MSIYILDKYFMRIKLTGANSPAGGPQYPNHFRFSYEGANLFITLHLSPPASHSFSHA